eukprot:GGOE01028158.1.p2 GENE.GGOE01028158.1~~GGOE01028158.1.p2  ORF type:complete len:162 (+),score=6.20 GGOE01028158.1:612-1097(+)
MVSKFGEGCGLGSCPGCPARKSSATPQQVLLWLLLKRLVAVGNLPVRIFFVHLVLPAAASGCVTSMTPPRTPPLRSLPVSLPPPSPGELIQSSPGVPKRLRVLRCVQSPRLVTAVHGRAPPLPSLLSTALSCRPATVCIASFPSPRRRCKGVHPVCTLLTP